MRVTNTSIYRNFTFTANDLHSKLIKSFSKIGGNSKKYEKQEVFRWILGCRY